MSMAVRNKLLYKQFCNFPHSNCKKVNQNSPNSEQAEYLCLSWSSKTDKPS